MLVCLLSFTFLYVFMAAFVRNKLMITGAFLFEYILLTSFLVDYAKQSCEQNENRHQIYHFIGRAN